MSRDLAFDLSQAIYQKPRQARIDPSKCVNHNDPFIKQEILAMIIEYLQKEGLHSSVVTLSDEANVMVQKSGVLQAEMAKLRDAIIDGNWSEVDKLCARRTYDGSIVYQLLVQQYLELIDKGESQKAYSFLQRRLKPLELVHSNSSEFSSLCYLLSCKSVSDCQAFRNWDGVVISRERLAMKVQSFIQIEKATTNAASVPLEELNLNLFGKKGAGNIRLVQLIQQAMAYQIEFSQYQTKDAALCTVSTIMKDFEMVQLPNELLATYSGHKKNVKCLEFLKTNSEGGHNYLLSGGYQLKLWLLKNLPTSNDPVCNNSMCVASSAAVDAERMWDVKSSNDGKWAVTCTSDGSISMWTLPRITDLDANSRKCNSQSYGIDDEALITCKAKFSVKLVDEDNFIGGKDAYCVRIHSGQTHLVSGHYDGYVRLWDIETQKCISAFGSGEISHRFEKQDDVTKIKSFGNTFTGSVSSIATGTMGNMLLAGYKDSTIQIWDLLSGLSVRTLTSHSGQITSLEVSKDGSKLLSGSKDNSNRMWDLGTGNVFQRYKGHLNTSHNFIKCSFGPSEQIVCGGSEDGKVYQWNAYSGDILSSLSGHASVVYEAKWDSKSHILASCSNDCRVKLWWYKPPCVI